MISEEQFKNDKISFRICKGQEESVKQREWEVFITYVLATFYRQEFILNILGCKFELLIFEMALVIKQYVLFAFLFERTVLLALASTSS